MDCVTGSYNLSAVAIQLNKLSNSEAFSLSVISDCVALWKPRQAWLSLNMLSQVCAQTQNINIRYFNFKFKQNLNRRALPLILKHQMQKKS